MISVNIVGLRELDSAFSELSRGLQKSTLQRVLLKAAIPVVDAAQRLSPYEKGGLVRSINASTKVPHDIPNAGKAAFAAALRGGGSRVDAIAALRGARRESSGGPVHAEVYIGPDRRPAIIQEWGTYNQPAQPFMRPAWDAQRNETLDIIGREMAGEIARSVQRASKRALKAMARTGK